MNKYECIGMYGLEPVILYHFQIVTTAVHRLYKFCCLKVIKFMLQSEVEVNAMSTASNSTHRNRMRCPGPAA